MRSALRFARLFAVLGLGAAFGVLVALLCALTRRELLPLRQRLTRVFLARLGRALPFRLRIEGEAPSQPMLWVSNHISWADIPLIGGLAPLSFLSKSDVRRWPLAGWLAQQAGTLFIRRGAGDSGQLSQSMAQRLRLGLPVLIFPEGTSSDGSGVRHFHGRMLSAAIDAQRPLQPLAISYLRAGERDPLAPFVGDDELVAHLRRLFAGDIAEVRIQFLEPIASLGRSRSQLADEARASIERALYGERETAQAA
jgi:1-acyl-sn-glycerol-3-phosphate acyltransferase